MRPPPLLSPFFLPFLVSALLFAAEARAADCNSNGVDDAVDLSNATSADCNSNSIPDECDVSARAFTPGTITEFDLAQRNVGGLSLLDLLPTRVADFNNDMLPDLWGTATGFSVGGPVSFIFIYLNQGGNTFSSSPVEFSFSGVTGFSTTFLTDTQTGDFDNDGDLDILFRRDDVQFRGIPSASFSVNVLVNDGAGNFTSQPTNIAALLPAVPATGASGARRVVQAHLASAVSKDLVMLHEGRIYGVYHTGGLNYVAFDMGAAAAATDLSAGKFIGPSQTILAFNTSDVVGQLYAPGDGSLQRLVFPFDNLAGSDVIAAKLGGSGDSTSEHIHLFSGPEATLSSFGVPEFSGYSAIGISGQLQEYPSGVESTPVRVGSVSSLLDPLDFDNDGDLDLPVFGLVTGEVLLNDGDGHFTARLKLFHPETVRRPLAVYDFNNDQKPDVLFQSATSGKAAILMNASAVPFLPPLAVDADADDVPDSCERATSGDHDGDRKSDQTVVRDINGSLFWFTLPSTSDFTSSLAANPTPIILGTSADSLLAGDFDGDGLVTPGVAGPFGNGLRWQSVKGDSSIEVKDFGLAGDFPIAGYFDGDRSLDRAIVRNFAGFLQWFIQRSSTMDDSYTEVLFGLTGDAPFAGDVNGDGIDELIVSRTQPDGQIVWFSYTLSSAQTSAPVPWGLFGDKFLPPSDFDADGKADFVVVRPIGGILQTFVRGTRTSSFGVSQQLAFGLPGDEIYLSHSTKMPVAEISVRRGISYFSAGPFGEFYNRLGAGTTQRAGFFGFKSDILVGSDGKAVRRYAPLGGLFCATNAAPGTYFWDPSPKRPRYFVPAGLASSVSSIAIYSTFGTQLDTMKAKRRGSTEWSARKRTAAQLYSGALNGPVVVQTVLTNGTAVCHQIDFPPQSSG